MGAPSCRNRIKPFLKHRPAMRAHSAGAGGPAGGRASSGRRRELRGLQTILIRCARVRSLGKKETRALRVRGCVDDADLVVAATTSARAHDRQTAGAAVPVVEPAAAAAAAPGRVDDRKEESRSTGMRKRNERREEGRRGKGKKGKREAVPTQMPSEIQGTHHTTPVTERERERRWRPSVLPFWYL